MVAQAAQLDRLTDAMLAMPGGGGKEAAARKLMVEAKALADVVDGVLLHGARLTLSGDGRRARWSRRAARACRGSRPGQGSGQWAGNSTSRRQNEERGRGDRAGRQGVEAVSGGQLLESQLRAPGGPHGRIPFKLS